MRRVIHVFIPAAIGCLLGLACGGDNGNVTDPDEPVATRLYFTGTVRLDGSPLQGAKVILERCDWSHVDLVSGNCSVPQRSEVMTGPGGQYQVTRTAECVRSQALDFWHAPNEPHSLMAQVPIHEPIEHSTYVYGTRTPGETALLCTETTQVFDFDAALVLAISGRVTRLDGPISPFTRVQQWREGNDSHNGSLQPASDGTYRLGFVSCWIETGEFFVQAIDPTGHLRSERVYLNGCEPKLQVVDLVLQPE